MRLASGLLALLFVVSSASASDWPQWQGPHRDGLSPKTGLLTRWPADGPPLALPMRGRAPGVATRAWLALYMHYANGTMVLAKASPDAYDVISSFKVPHNGDRPGWSHPIIADGKLFIRCEDLIRCYDIKARSAKD